MEDRKNILQIIRQAWNNFIFDYYEGDTEDQNAILYKIARLNLYRVRILLVFLMIFEPCFLLLTYLNYGHANIMYFILIELCLVLRGLVLYRLFTGALNNKDLSINKIKVLNYFFWLQMVMIIGIVFWKDPFNFNWRFLLITLYILLSMIPFFKVKEILIFIFLEKLFIFGKLPLQTIDGWTIVHTIVFSMLTLGISFIRYKEFYKNFYKERHLLAENQKLKWLSITDSLTGLLNRRGFEEAIQKMWQHPDSKSLMISAVIIDVDDFKSFNDNCGHYEGDYCLCQISAIIKDLFQNYTKAIARIGGDEFAVLLINVNHSELIEITKELQQRIQNLNKNNTRGLPNISVSIGITAPQPISQISWVDLYKEADDLLYTAKNQGINNIVDISTT